MQMGTLLVIQAASTRAVPTCERTDFLWLPVAGEEVLDRLVHMLAVDAGLRSEYARWRQDGYQGVLFDPGCRIWILHFPRKPRGFDSICRAIEASEERAAADGMSYSDAASARSVADALSRVTPSRPSAGAVGQGLLLHGPSGAVAAV